MPDKKTSNKSLPIINVDVKTPPNSGGFMSWGPIMGWLSRAVKTTWNKVTKHRS